MRQKSYLPERKKAMAKPSLSDIVILVKPLTNNFQILISVSYLLALSLFDILLFLLLFSLKLFFIIIWG